MRNKTRMLVEAGLLIAVAQILSYIVIWQMPQGGSVTAGSMIPIMIFAIRWGAGPGILAGAVYGILQFILGPKHSFHVISILFDYPIAFAGLGLAGLYRKNYFTISIGVVLGILVRLTSHVISGALVFYEYAGAQNPWIYSIGYNIPYLAVELVISIVIVGILYKVMKPYLTDQVER